MLLSHTSAHAGLSKFSSSPLPPRAWWLPLNFLDFRLLECGLFQEALPDHPPSPPPLLGSVEYSFCGLPLYPSHAIWLKLSSLVNLKFLSNRDWFSLVSSGSALPTPPPTHPPDCVWHLGGVQWKCSGPGRMIWPQSHCWESSGLCPRPDFPQVQVMMKAKNVIIFSFFPRASTGQTCFGYLWWETVKRLRACTWCQTSGSEARLWNVLSGVTWAGYITTCASVSSSGPWNDHSTYPYLTTFYED